MTLEGKIIVITGAGRGLGKVMADVFQKRGAKVVASSLNSLKFPADVRKESDMQKLAADAVAKFGRIDIWINNAGVWLAKMPVEELDMQKVRELFEVNTFGAMNGCRVALRVMKKQKGENGQGGGTIVNIVSTAALIGRPFTAAYSASKHAEKGFIDSLREELKEEKSAISIIGIYPGGIKTELFGAEKPADFDTFMEPEFVAEAVVVNLEKEKPDNELILRRAGQNLKI